MAKHTKSPWVHTGWRITGSAAAAGFVAARKISESSPEVFVKEIGQHPSIGQEQVGIALGMTKEEAEENACLMASAPDLLAALQEMVKWFGRYPEFTPNETHYSKYREAIDKSHVAIFKATGQCLKGEE